MQQVGAEVGFSETAFLRTDGSIRYFSPIAEVPFCVHATIATAVALAARNGAGSLTFQTPVGPVELETTHGADGVMRAALTSVEPCVEELAPAALDRLLVLLGRSDEPTSAP